MVIELIDYGYKHKPKQNTYADAGYDVYTTEEISIPNGCVGMTGVGFGIKLPQGYMAAVFPRSGKTRDGLICQLPPVDSGYEGEIHAIIVNNTGEDVTIPEDTKIGQLVILPIVSGAEFVTAEEFEALDKRGTKAFGSSGG